MDIPRQAARLGLEPEEYKELLQLFIQNTRREILEIKKALLENDFKKSADLVHSFKGAAVNLGIDGIADYGEVLWHAIRNRHSDIEPLIDKVINEVDRLSQTL